MKIIFLKRHLFKMLKKAKYIWRDVLGSVGKFWKYQQMPFNSKIVSILKVLFHFCNII